MPTNAPLRVEEDPENARPRAGLKLEGVLQALAMRLEDKGVLDIGQSTGGFTDCALQFGARHVVGVEVGHDQLASHLRSDPRVTCLEGLNARHMSTSEALLSTLAERPIDLAVMDVSFISQTLILPEIAALLPPSGQLLSLVKPQFELDPVRWINAASCDPRRYAGWSKLRTACEQCGLVISHWQESPITGSDAIGSFFFSPASPAVSSTKQAGGSAWTAAADSPCSGCSQTSSCSKAIFTPASEQLVHSAVHLIGGK